MAKEEKTRFLFLYTRLPDYFYGCLEYLVGNYEVEVHVVKFSSDINTRFELESKDGIHLYDYEEVVKEGVRPFIDKIDPHVIYTAGWSNKKYRKAVKGFKDKIPVILGMDNLWRGTIRQYVGILLSRVYLKSTYSHVWVPGPDQYAFAQRLGYKAREIIMGLYVANERRFRPAGDESKVQLEIKKNLIFLGRYVDYKRPLMLVQAFLQLKQNDRLNGWSLSFYGDGPLRQELIARTEEHSEIAIHGFRSPKNLKQVFEEAGAFCLPSKNEHWGVVVHEATMCGLPVILSDTCGAASKLLIHGYNGFGFKTDSHSDLTMALDQIFHLPAEELRRMSRNSRKMSGSLTQERWAAALMSVL